MNRPAEVFVQGLQCIEDAIYTGHVNTSLARMVTFSGAKCVNAFHYPEKAVLQWEAHTR